MLLHGSMLPRFGIYAIPTRRQRRPIIAEARSGYSVAIDAMACSVAMLLHLASRLLRRESLLFSSRVVNETLGFSTPDL